MEEGSLIEHVNFLGLGSSSSVGISYKTKDITSWPRINFVAFGFVVTGIMMLAASVAYGAIKASKTLHEALLSNIMRCPMSFFDTTPLGRIINRFSKDVDTLDAELRMFIQVFSLTMQWRVFQVQSEIYRALTFPIN